MRPTPATIAITIALAGLAAPGLAASSLGHPIAAAGLVDGSVRLDGAGLLLCEFRPGAADALLEPVHEGNQTTYILSYAIHACGELTDVCEGREVAGRIEGPCRYGSFVLTELRKTPVTHLADLVRFQLDVSGAIPVWESKIDGPEEDGLEEDIVLRYRARGEFRGVAEGLDIVYPG